MSNKRDRASKNKKRSGGASRSRNTPVPRSQQPRRRGSPNEAVLETTTTLEATIERFVGPLPHPDILRQFGEIDPSFPERIVTMAEQQSAHRRELETQHVGANNKRSVTGMWLGFSLSIAALALSAAFIWTGHEVPGTILASTDLTVLATVFVIGRRGQARERTDRLKWFERLFRRPRS